jgi:hypothetical protein
MNEEDCIYSLTSSSVDFTDRRSVTSMEDLGFSMPLRGSEKPSAMYKQNEEYIKEEYQQYFHHKSV